MIKKYSLYLLRWQLSTPILAIFVWWLTESLGATWTTVLANFVGGLIFFWVDRWIFNATNILQGETWEVRNDISCADCGTVDRGYRLVKNKDYDKSGDNSPEFRCHKCSKTKYHKMFDSNDLK